MRLRNGLQEVIRRTPLKPVSTKRMADQRAYTAAVQRAVLRARGHCQALPAWPEIACWGRLDPHHIAPAGMYPKRRTDPDNIILVCRRHHDQIHHVDPAGARRAGLLGD